MELEPAGDASTLVMKRIDLVLGGGTFLVMERMVLARQRNILVHP
jgi:hypothetical protein